MQSFFPNFKLFYTVSGFFNGITYTLTTTGFTTPRGECENSKGFTIKSIVLHKLRKNEGKMPIETKIKKVVVLVFFNFGKGQYKTRDTVNQEHEIYKVIKTFTV